jgi:hypothetical protein
MRERLRRLAPPVDIASIAPGQTSLSLGGVGLATATGIAGAATSGLSPVVLGLAVVCGIATGLGSRWLSSVGSRW